MRVVSSVENSGHRTFDCQVQLDSLPPLYVLSLLSGELKDFSFQAVPFLHCDVRNGLVSVLS